MRGSAVFRTGVAPGGVLAGPWVKNELWRRARAVPSLDLRFADNKSLTDAVTGQSLVTFTRASSGTYVGSDGVLRTATTNLLLRSEEFDNASWSKTTTTVTANSETSPVGSVTADTLTWGVLQTAEAYQAVTLTAATHTFSIWAKTASGTKKFRLKYYNGTSDLFSAEQTATTQWQRFSYSFTGVAVSGNVSVRNSSPAEAGDLIVWGAQLEAGAFPTSYIPTTTATVTRSADVASITGTNFSSWYRQDEGTVFADMDRNTSISSASTAVSINDNSTGNRLHNFRQDSASALTVISSTGGTIDGALTLTLVNTSTRNKVVSAQALNNLSCVANGATAVSDTSVAMPVVNQMQIGHVTGTSFYNGTIRRLVFWSQRLSNSTLQEVTR